MLEEIYALALEEPGLVRVTQARLRPLGGAVESLDAFYRENGAALLAAAEKKAAELADEIGWFDVTATLSGDRLSCEIRASEAVRPRAQYYFYLIRDGKVVDKQGWTRKARHDWKLTECGMYCVQGYVKRGEAKVFRRSEPLGYFNAALRAEFRAFMASEPEGGYPFQPELKLYEARAPFADYLVCISRERDESGAERFMAEEPRFARAASVSCGAWNVTALASGGVRKLASGGTLLFSGVTMRDGKLLLGADELPGDVRFDGLAGGYGNFSCVFLGEDEVRFGNDYCSFSKWFYFEDGDRLILANRYHALLKYLALIGVPMELDERKAAIMLSCVDVQFLMQNFTRKMDVSPVRQLEADKTFRITGEGWRKENTPYGEQLSRRETYHENCYLATLGLAAREIREYVRTVLDDERYDHVLADLTGGLDSRVVYAALTGLRAHPSIDKVRIVSNPTAGMPDLPLATEINSLYGFPYDDLPRVTRSLEAAEADQIMRSGYMGVYYSFFPFTQEQTTFQYPSLTGGVGDARRPLFGRKYFHTTAEYSDTEEKFAGYIWSDFAANISAADEQSRADFQEVLGYELSQVPVDSPLEAYDRLYLQYRASYHFGSEYRWRIGSPAWLPLESKAAFQLHHMGFQYFKSIRSEIDLIGRLNPLLLSFPFADPLDNAALEKMKGRLAPTDPRLTGIKVSGTDDMARWDDARSRRGKAGKRERRAPDEEKRIQEEWSRRQESVYAALRDNFRELMRRHPALRERIGAALYHYIMRMSEDKTKMQYLYNKVTSLLDQDRVIGQR